MTRFTAFFLSQAMQYVYVVKFRRLFVISKLHQIQASFFSRQEMSIGGIMSKPQLSTKLQTLNVNIKTSYLCTYFLQLYRSRYNFFTPGENSIKKVLGTNRPLEYIL